MLTIGFEEAVYSDLLQESRTLSISLPDGFDSSGNERYHLLILLDGNSYFESVSSVARHLSRRNSLPKLIIAAIHNTERERDFTPSKIQMKRENKTGGGNQFLAFINQELIPYMERSYPISEMKILVGHSLGGFLATHDFLTKQTDIDAYLILDPSIPWEKSMMMKRVAEATPGPQRALYLATAWHEDQSRWLQRHQELVHLLHENQNELTIQHKLFEKEDHRSLPLIACYEGLKWLFQ